MNGPISIPHDAGRSWWLREALALPEFAGEPAPALTGETSADVVILGGGYTGLWTAVHLKELDPGVDVVIVEQDICGGGPSGRNGGFVSSFWQGLPHLVETFGDRQAIARIARAAGVIVFGGKKRVLTAAIKPQSKQANGKPRA